jgi:hypothetical protein
MSLTTGRVSMGTRQIVSLRQRNTAEDETGMIEICVMSSAIEVHVAGLKIGVRSTSALKKSSVKKWTMITTVPILTNLTESVLPKRGAMQEQSRILLTT